MSVLARAIPELVISSLNSSMRLVPLAVVFFCLTSVSLSQTGTVEGTVSLPDTSNWGGVVVTIIGQNKSAQTQPNGQFTISNVVPGAISIQAGKLFYANARKDTSLTPGGTITLMLNLTTAVTDTLVPQQTTNVVTGAANEGNIGAVNHFVEPGDPGFMWNGQQQLFEASLMVSVESTRVSDAARFILGIAQDNLDHDFQSLSDVVVLTQGPDSTVLLTAYDDSRSNLPPGVPSQPLGVRITQESYSFDQPLYNEFLIVKTVLKNMTTVTLTNIVVGWFVDWDVQQSFDSNRGGVWFVQNSLPGIDPFETEIVYERNQAGTAYVGMVPLTQAKFKSSRITSNAREIFVDSTNRYGALTEANKYRYMMSRRDTNRFSDWGIAEDLSMVVSTGGSGGGSLDSSTFTLAGGETVVVAFAFVGGADSAAFVQNALHAQLKWHDLNVVVSTPSKDTRLPAAVLLEQNYPNPFNPSTVIRYRVPTSGRVAITVYDLLGREIAMLADGYVEPGGYDIRWEGRDGENVPVATGVYFLRMDFTNSDGDRSVARRKLLFIK